MVTDGRSNITNIKAAAKILKREENVNVFAVGVGDRVLTEQLDAIAEAGIAGNQSHVFTIRGFIKEELDTLQKTVRARACFGEIQIIQTRDNA